MTTLQLILYIFLTLIAIVALSFFAVFIIWTANGFKKTYWETFSDIESVSFRLTTFGIILGIILL
jgi:hypothetical protein